MGFLVVIGLLWIGFYVLRQQSSKSTKNGAEPIRRSVKTPPLSQIGHEADECPSCHAPLKQPIRRKAPCKSCGEIIYPRKRPVDGRVVYFCEQELDGLEEQRAIANGTYDVFLAQKQRQEAVREGLRAKFGREPSDNDTSWAIFNEDLVTQAKAGQLGLYRNTKLSMAQMLVQEKKTKQALQTFLEVAVLDMNGVTNMVAGLSRAEMQELSVKPYDPEFAELLPYIVGEIVDCAAESETSDTEMESLFATAWKRAPARTRLPLDQAAGWAKLREAVAARRR